MRPRFDGLRRPFVQIAVVAVDEHRDLAGLGVGHDLSITDPAERHPGFAERFGDSEARG